MRFVNAVRAETAKLLTVRLWWLLMLILVVYIGFTAGVIGGLFGAIGDQMAAQPGAPALPPEMLPPLVYSTTTAVGYVFPLLLGAMLTTGEFRHQTLTPTFLATPRRGVVLGSKLFVLAVAGAVFGVAGLVASMGAGAPLLELTGNDAALGESETWLLAARVVLAMALWAVIGVGVGVLVPNQVASIVIVLAFTQFVEPILRLMAPTWEWTAEVGKFLPGAASDALVGASIYSAFAAGPGEAKILEWWQGGLVLLAFAVLAAAIGYVTSWRKDVT